MEVGFSAEAQSNTASAKWEGLKVGDEGKPLDIGSSSYVSVQVSGNFGEGGCLELEGSNNGEFFMLLKDVHGMPLKKFSPSIDGLDQLVKYIRPVVRLGDGLTELNCSVQLHRRA